MKFLSSKANKSDIKREQHVTRPPRLEGKVKNAKMNPILKKKKSLAEVLPNTKVQGYTAQQLKDYQLRSKNHG